MLAYFYLVSAIRGSRERINPGLHLCGACYGGTLDGQCVRSDPQRQYNTLHL